MIYLLLICLNNVCFREVGDFHLMDTIFDLARPHFQDFAIIVVCSAELKLNKGIRAEFIFVYLHT